MEKLKELKTFLAGKKTYVIAALMVILGVMTDNKELIMEGFGLATLRAGVNKLER